MGRFYATISVENSNLNAVKDELGRIVGAPIESASASALDLLFNIEDREEIYREAESYINLHGLDDDTVMPPGTSSSNFGIEIDVQTSFRSIGANFIAPVSDAIAAQLSKALNTRTMLWLGDTASPLHMYESGRIVFDGADRYGKILGWLRWIPKGGMIGQSAHSAEYSDTADSGSPTD